MLSIKNSDSDSTSRAVASSSTDAVSPRGNNAFSMLFQKRERSRSAGHAKKPTELDLSDLRQQAELTDIGVVLKKQSPRVLSPRNKPIISSVMVEVEESDSLRASF